MSDYLRVIASLPVSDTSQTDAFAQKVAIEHSWYKHLPFFFSGARFVFFLDPNAEQQEQFGHWAYHVLDNPGTSADRFSAQVTINSKSVAIPESVIEQCGDRFTAFLKHSPTLYRNLFSPARRRQLDNFLSTPGAEQPDPHEDLPRYRALAQAMFAAGRETISLSLAARAFAERETAIQRRQLMAVLHQSRAYFLDQR